MRFKLTIVFLAGLISCCFTPQKNKVIQIDITGLLNARPVTTFTGGKLVSWTKGIDGGGSGDGYLTHSAAEFNGDKDAHALPDDPIFPANTSHPEIRLHYNNADSTHYQARYISGAGEFMIKIPKGHYSEIYLGLTSSEGPSSLQFELIYADGRETKNEILPDYYDNVSAKYPDVSFIATDLAKWGKENKMTEKDHHNIHVLKLSINAQKQLIKIKISKSKESYLMFWSATIVTD